MTKTVWTGSERDATIFLDFFSMGRKGPDLLGIFDGIGAAWGRDRSGAASGIGARLESDAFRTLVSIPMRVSKDQWEKVKARYFAGESWVAIANDLQVPVATLKSRARKSGIARVKREAKDLSLKRKSEQIEQSIESLSKLMRSKLASDAVSTLERVDKYDITDIREENTREQVLSSLAKRSALVFGWNDQSENATVSINLLNALPDKVITVTDEKQIE